MKLSLRRDTAVVNVPIDKHVFQNQRVVFYAVKLTPTRPVWIDLYLSDLANY